MRRMVWAIAAVAGLALLGAPEGASAQQADGWWEWAGESAAAARDRRGGSLGDVILGRDDRNRGQARRNAGPPFCRNGQGHPVHGRQWCRDKGFGTGAGGILRWEERGWGDVILRSPRGAERRGAVDRGGLIDVLGDVVLGRLAAEGSRMGAREPLTGRWVHTDRAGAVLQIRSGSVPVAELTDLDGNGRVDLVLVPAS